MEPVNGTGSDLMERLRALGICLDNIVISGVSLGLPTSEKAFPVFDRDNATRILRGESFLQNLSDDDKQGFLAKNVCQIHKSSTGERVKTSISSISQVIQVASKIGRLDLVTDYGLNPAVVETLDTTYALAVAAGIEAAKSAGLITKPSSLPEQLQAGTGVIFASSFPALDSLVDEVSRCVAKAVAAETEREVMSRVVESLEGNFDSGSMAVGQREEREKWIRQLMQETQTNTKKEGDVETKVKVPIGSYEFNRKLLFRLLVMGNAQLAEILKAKGPNTQMNAACASTTQAICIAEDWIRMGRCHRVIVVGADNATSDNLMHYIGTGFLALGAASTACGVENAAKPFDKNRNGMVLGAGAVGLVVEGEQECSRRQHKPLAKVLGTHTANSAFHASLLDRKHIASELEVFVRKIERVHNIQRQSIARSLAYMSHETFTSAHGGCALVEIDALRAVFGEDAVGRDIVLTNTKGMTGHPMGCGIEVLDAMSVETLVRGEIPPVVNFREKDELLGDIQVSKGGKFGGDFVLRFAAGFGSHFVYILYGKAQ